jgi:hypothetical protein
MTAPMTIPLEEHVARWMISKSLATGHGDTVEDMLNEAEWQIRESERAACEAIAREHAELTGDERVRRVSEAIVSDIAARKGKGEGD